MTMVDTEKITTFSETTLRKNKEPDTDPVPLTNPYIIPGSDSAGGHGLPVGGETYYSEAELQALRYASHERENFDAIDQQVDGFIGVLGKDLSEVQAVTTDPAILIRQAEHLTKAAAQLIDGAKDSKIAIRQRNEQNLGEEVSVGSANNDLKTEEAARHKRIVDVLLANRAAREGLLQAEVSELRTSIEGFRQYLSETNPSQLMAFDAHFTAKKLSTEASVSATDDQVEMPTTAELERRVENVTDETVSPARGITILGSRAVERLFIRPFRRS